MSRYVSHLTYVKIRGGGVIWRKFPTGTIFFFRNFVAQVQHDSLQNDRRFLLHLSILLWCEVTKNSSTTQLRLQIGGTDAKKPAGICLCGLESEWCERLLEISRHLPLREEGCKEESDGVENRPEDAAQDGDDVHRSFLDDDARHAEPAGHHGDERSAVVLVDGRDEDPDEKGGDGGNEGGARSTGDRPAAHHGETEKKNVEKDRGGVD